MQPNIRAHGGSSISLEEVARFDAMSGRWWDPEGPMRPLHEMNPVRIDWISKRIATRLAGGRRRLLDVGCGAGLAAEALATEGHDVIGIDAAAEAIRAAEAHAAGMANAPRYRIAAAEELLAEEAQFDIITALEVIEHVVDPPEFLATLARLLVPGGVLFISTLNRTPRSFITAKLGAEYVMRMLPIGTHDWRKFITPAELGAMATLAGLRLSDTAGMTYDLKQKAWRTTRDLGVNYIAMAEG